MRSIVSQSVLLPPPAAGLFEMYMDPPRHAAITGEPGSTFEAFGGSISGVMLQVTQPRLAFSAA
jgi:hypothetical protein